MNAELEAIKDAWDKNTGNGREEVLTREMCDAYVAAHPERFTDYHDLTLEEIVETIGVFRRVGFEERQWEAEVWQLHRFEPQNIGGVAKVVVRRPLG